MLPMPPDTALTDSLAEIARRHLGETARVARLRLAPRAPDGTLLFTVDAAGKKAVLQLSPEAFPDVAAEGADRARSFAEALGEPLSEGVLLPIAQGRIGASSYAILPWHAPIPEGRLRSWLARRRMTAPLLDWLAATAGRARLGDAATYIINLRALADVPQIDPALRDRAEAGIRAIDQGQAAPLHIPMHGDLWKGNVLQGGERGAFTIIDWRGSRVDGYPLFDLVRLAESFGLPARRLRAELQRHADVLGAPLQDGEIQLLAAIGHYARNRGEMPLEAFRGMAKSSFEAYMCAAALPAS